MRPRLWKNAEQKPDILFVDGYNVINVWPELKALCVNLEHARDRLVDILSEYGAYKGIDIYVVFDAHYSSEPERRIISGNGLQIIFTCSGETADSCIEKMVYQMVREGNVVVATSDRDEQMTALGMGACRMSARELGEAVRKAKKEMREKNEEGSWLSGRHEIGSRLAPETAAFMDLLRCDKWQKK